MLDDKLFELQKAANRHPDPLAIWIVYALTRYFQHGATAMFEKQFIAYPTENYSYMISYCMNRDRSDTGIIKSIRKLIA